MPRCLPGSCSNNVQTRVQNKVMTSVHWPCCIGTKREPVTQSNQSTIDQPTWMIDSACAVFEEAHCCRISWASQQVIVGIFGFERRALALFIPGSCSFVQLTYMYIYVYSRQSRTTRFSCRNIVWGRCWTNVYHSALLGM